eukprot:356534-Chlamydomonas_euryale.AAC.8
MSGESHVPIGVACCSAASYPGAHPFYPPSPTPSSLTAAVATPLRRPADGRHQAVPPVGLADAGSPGELRDQGRGGGGNARSRSSNVAPAALRPTPRSTALRDPAQQRSSVDERGPEGKWIKPHA